MIGASIGGCVSLIRSRQAFNIFPSDSIYYCHDTNNTSQ